MPEVRRKYSDLSEDEDQRATSLMRSSLVIDTIGSSLIKPEPPIIDGKSYIDRALAAGVNVLGVTLAAHADTFDVFEENVAANLDLLAARPATTLQVESLATSSAHRPPASSGSSSACSQARSSAPRCRAGR